MYFALASKICLAKCFPYGCKLIKILQRLALENVGDRWITYSGEPITIGTNCIIRARFTDEQGTITTGTVSNIDTQAPEIDVKTLTRMGMAWDNHFGFGGAYRIDEKYISISFKDADETKYTGSSGIKSYMLCNPDGSTFVDNRGICSTNLYDINNTYQKGGWYWFYMVKNNLGREKTVTSKHNCQEMDISMMM